MIEKERINRKEFEALFGGEPVSEEAVEVEETERPLLAEEGENGIANSQDQVSDEAEMEGNESEDDE